MTTIIIISPHPTSTNGYDIEVVNNDTAIPNNTLVGTLQDLINTHNDSD
jgi:hypothetical protein